MVAKRPKKLCIECDFHKNGLCRRLVGRVRINPVDGTELKRNIAGSAQDQRRPLTWRGIFAKLFGCETRCGRNARYFLRIPPVHNDAGGFDAVRAARFANSDSGVEASVPLPGGRNVPVNLRQPDGDTQALSPETAERINAMPGRIKKAAETIRNETSKPATKRTPTKKKTAAKK